VELEFHKFHWNERNGMEWYGMVWNEWNIMEHQHCILRVRGKGPKSANRLFDPKSGNTMAVDDVHSAFVFVDFLTIRQFPCLSQTDSDRCFPLTLPF
jgi:hypothetical protein